LGPLRYFEQIGSTNDEAAKWCNAGAEHLALVIANEQTCGRGRAGRRWFTPSGAALAFSLILRHQVAASSSAPFLLSRLTALGALAISQALRDNYGLKAQIKWPNDVLLARRKTAGVLAEAHWQGETLSAVILGLGINITPASIPPDQELAFPATCIEHHIDHPIAREEMLERILANLLHLYQNLEAPEFLSLWQDSLAFVGEETTILDSAGSTLYRGHILGLDELGQLKLLIDNGEILALHTGEVHLRPANP
jgi:BirA family biotin operon repressor/biotin-[acetyl-CoA-carboxylase] ligase